MGARVIQLAFLFTMGLIPASFAAPLSVTEFVVDQASLRGKKVQVEGTVTCANGTCQMEDEDDASSNSVSFSWSRLSRENRLRLAKCSAQNDAPCRVIVSGAVPVEPNLLELSKEAAGDAAKLQALMEDMVNGLVIDEIIWKK